MPCRIEDGSVTVSWTVTREIAIGHHGCGACDVETPRPTMDVMIAHAKEWHGTLWPGRGDDQWMPPGWGWDGDRGLLCPDCVSAKDAALDARRPKGDR